MSDRTLLKERATEIRRIAVSLIYGAGSGHPGSCLSAADVIAVLYFQEMRLGGTANSVPDDGSVAADDRDRTIKSVPDDIPSALNVVPVDIDATIKVSDDIDRTVKTAPYDVDATVKAAPYHADVGRSFTGASTVRDRFVLSKGHACPALYAALHLRGQFDRAALGSFRRLGGLLQGSPTTAIPGIDATCGSLGQGFSIALGLALGLRDQTPASEVLQRVFSQSEPGPRVFVMLGDGELQEGEIWEGAMAAGHYKLGNLCAIVDYNKLQSDDLNERIMRLEPLDAKWRAFNWNAITIDGHNFDEIAAAFAQARATHDKPTVIIANTIKGKGVSYMEGVPSWHGSVKLKPEEIRQALADLGVADDRQPEYAFHV
jgi:transketolase